MTRNEALVILELQGNATDQQIKKKLEERIAYYEGLSNNSPSAFLRRLNAQHLAKLMIVQKTMPSILQQPLIIPHPKEENEDAVTEREQIALTIPVIISSAKKKEVKKEQANEPLAFLVSHTENQAIKPFPLFSGKTYIGRKPHDTLKPFIALEEDEFVSRVHAVIYIDDKKPPDCFLEDSATSNEGRASSNGTFLNGNKERITGKVKIKENDTIQIGETKLIFRMNTSSLNKIVQEVEDRDYMHTVVIRL